MARANNQRICAKVSINRGIAPVESEDPEVAPLVARCVLEKKTLTATFTYDALALAVRHQAYLHLDPDDVLAWTGRPVAVIDCFGILDDTAIRRYFELGCEVKGLGRGHVKRIKDQVRTK